MLSHNTPAEFAYWTDEDGTPLLNEATRRHLLSSAALLADELRQEVDMAADEILRGSRKTLDPWMDDGRWSDVLPVGYRLRYDRDTPRLFMHCLDAVVFKLGQLPDIGLVCSCTMEELAMRAIIERAVEEREVALDMEDDYCPDYDPADVDLSDVREWAFEDGDHEILFMRKLDGAENDAAISADLGLDAVRYENWLMPFMSTSTRPHPFAWPGV